MGPKRSRSPRSRKEQPGSSRDATPAPEPGYQGGKLAGLTPAAFKLVEKWAWGDLSVALLQLLLV